MTTNKKALNKQGIIVIAIALIATLLLMVFIFSNSVDDNKATDKVVLEENGEASYLNLSVPNANQKEDSLSMIDKLEKIKNDSINKAKLSTSGLDEYDAYQKKTSKYNDRSNSYTKTDNYSTSAPAAEPRKTVASNKKQSRKTYNPSSFDEPLDNNEAKTIIVDKEDKKTERKSGFFKSKKETSSVNDNDIGNDESLNILACIHTNQTIMNNQRVKFRTTKEFYYNGQKFPINTIIYGLASIKPNRLIIKINKINQTDIKFEVFDSEDSQQGLYVLTPNLNASLQKEFKKEGIEDDDLKKIPFSRSLKNLFEKKIKEEKVQLLNNYKVLIKICKDE